MAKNAIVGQSGGPTSVINASLAGVYESCKRRGAGKVYGMLHGVAGLLERRTCVLDDKLKTALDIELLKRTPSSYLGSCRYKLPENLDASVYLFLPGLLPLSGLSCPAHFITQALVSDSVDRELFGYCLDVLGNSGSAPRRTASGVLRGRVGIALPDARLCPQRSFNPLFSDASGSAGVGA